ncbi:hypothetical protein P7K49_006065, partial [Saguinus oedipus]
RSEMKRDSKEERSEVEGGSGGSKPGVGGGKLFVKFRKGAGHSARLRESRRVSSAVPRPGGPRCPGVQEPRPRSEGRPTGPAPGDPPRPGRSPLRPSLQQVAAPSALPSLAARDPAPAGGPQYRTAQAARDPQLARRGRRARGRQRPPAANSGARPPFAPPLPAPEHAPHALAPRPLPARACSSARPAASGARRLPGCPSSGDRLPWASEARAFVPAEPPRTSDRGPLYLVGSTRGHLGSGKRPGGGRGSSGQDPGVESRAAERIDGRPYPSRCAADGPSSAVEGKVCVRPELRPRRVS